VNYFVAQGQTGNSRYCQDQKISNPLIAVALPRPQVKPLSRLLRLAAFRSYRVIEAAARDKPGTVDRGFVSTEQLAIKRCWKPY